KPLLPPNPSAVPYTTLFRSPEDRLQGRKTPAAVHLRARKDRAQPDHRGLRQQAARAVASHQARTVPRAIAVRHPMIKAGAQTLGDRKSTRLNSSHQII